MIALRRLAIAGVDVDHLQAIAGGLRDVIKSRRLGTVCEDEEAVARLDQARPERL